MIVDFVLGVFASIVASIICGIFSHRVIGKNSDILTSIYTIYISFSAFVFVILLTFLMSHDLLSVISTWSGTSVFNLIRYICMLFGTLFFNITIVTIIFIIIRQIELNAKSSSKAHQDYMKMLHELEMSENKNEI